MDIFSIFKAFWPFFVLVIVIFGVVLVLKLRSESLGEEDKTPYQKKKYIFDALTELELFRILLETVGDRYHVFVQVNYSHLIEPKKMDFKEERRYRSRIDRKSADFVLCDKENVIPQLVIELDGGSHNSYKKHIRDEFIDDITKVAGLPILHLKTGNMDKEFIKGEIEKALAVK